MKQIPVYNGSIHYFCLFYSETDLNNLFKDCLWSCSVSLLRYDCINMHVNAWKTKKTSRICLEHPFRLGLWHQYFFTYVLSLSCRSHIFNYHVARQSQQLLKPLDISLLQLKTHLSNERHQEKREIHNRVLTNSPPVMAWLNCSFVELHEDYFEEERHIRCVLCFWTAFSPLYKTERCIFSRLWEASRGMENKPAFVVSEGGLCGANLCLLLDGNKTQISISCKHSFLFLPASIYISLNGLESVALDVKDNPSE